MIDQKDQIKAEIIRKLRLVFAQEPDSAPAALVYQASALTLRDLLTERLLETRRKMQGKRQVHYLCMEFLLGRSLRASACKLGLQQAFEDALTALGHTPAAVYDIETDPGLGNGGLGRLAAGYLDSMAALGVYGTGYGILYENGFFRQRIIDGAQYEFADGWLKTGAVWLLPAADRPCEVRIGGQVDAHWEDGRLIARHTGYTPVCAVPYDMPVAGYDTTHAVCLRLWQAQSPEPLDMALFAQGEHVRAAERAEAAKAISRVLYPEDSHLTGRILRLRQYYFLASATVQSICAKHKAQYGTLAHFAEKNVIHINDTSTVFAIPELMRILLDQEGMAWEQAWDIVCKSVVYTHHAALFDGPDTWPTDMMQAIVPRIMMITDEINERYCRQLWEHAPGDFEQIARLAIVADGEVRMAALAVAGSFSVSGVTPVHSEMLQTRIFADCYQEQPEKFCHVTCGISLRRWLCEVNPALCGFVRARIGAAFVYGDLSALAAFTDDEAACAAIAAIKRRNKERLAAYILEKNGIAVDVDSMFDVQIKSLHESRRQLLKILHVIALYHRIKRAPDAAFQPRTVIFCAKAAPGYAVAKKIIQLMHSVADMVQADAETQGKLCVVFLADYNVSLAEQIVPAAELSEQISAVGHEASGTGGMKLMLNGAITIGARDGINLEILRAVGAENILLFGMEAAEAESLMASGSYFARDCYNQSPVLRDVLDHMRSGFGDGIDYAGLVQMLIDGGPGRTDYYLICKDFDDYIHAQDRAEALYQDPAVWNRMSLVNIANAGHFAAEQAVAAYAARVWQVPVQLP